jgi:hypothetical protein
MSDDGNNYIDAALTEHTRAEAPRATSSYDAAPPVVEGWSQAIEVVASALGGYVVVYDANGQVLHCNASLRALMASNITTNTPPSLAAPLLQVRGCDEQGQVLPQEQWPVARILRGETVVASKAASALLRRPDGFDLRVHVCGSPLQNRRGALVFFQEAQAAPDAATTLHDDILPTALDADWLDLNDLLTEVVARVQIAAPHHQFYLQLTHILPLLWGNKERLAQAFAYLLNLVVKCSSAGGEISVSSIYEQYGVHVSIAYRGVDRAADELGELLSCWASELKSQRSRARSIDKELVLICAAIRLHDGQVWAESTTYNGTTLHCTLPLSVVL